MVVRPLRQNAEPAHKVDMHTKNRQQWEEEVFDDAAYFNACWKIGPNQIYTRRFETFPDVLRAVTIYDGTELRRDPAAMVYVVASNDVAFCIPPKEWLEYIKKWETKHGAHRG